MSVKVYVPAAVFELVVTLSVLLPDPPATELGLKVAAAPAGRPPAVKVTVPVKPPDGVTLAV